MGRGITERSNRKRAMNHNGADPRMVGARFILTGSSQVSQHHECLCRWRKNAHTKSLAYILTRSVWPPLLVWLLPACRVKKWPFIPCSVFIFPLFYSGILPPCLILAPSLSHSFFCSRPYFQSAWLAAAPWRLPSGGPFVGTALVELKRVPGQPPTPTLLFLSQSTLLLSVLLGLIV